MTINPVTFQSLEGMLSDDQVIRQCAPTAFYMVLAGAGYLPKDESLGQLCLDLQEADVFTDAYQKHNWSRPGLSRYMRRRYHAPIVSWQLHWPPPQNMEAMQRAGYVETEQEIDFFTREVEGKSVEELVRQGYPVIVTVKPHFIGMPNTSVHSIIVLDWKDDEVTIIDPDGRNSRTKLTPAEMIESISDGAAGTIILPKK